MIELIEDAFDHNRNAPGFIFDGFPRTIAQADALDVMLARHHQEIDVVLRLVVDDSKLLARVEKRFAEEGRPDDNPESFKKRLDAYNRDTAPLVPIYREQGKLAEIDGMADIATVAAGIAKALS